jgi:uncharacterized membrane-anchored protein
MDPIENVAKPVIAGWMGCGTVSTSLVFLALIVALVVRLTITKTDTMASASERLLAPSEA